MATDDIPNIRTYKHDVAETLGREDVSVASIAIQEQTKRYSEAEATEKEIKTSKLLVTGIGILVFLGAMALAYIFFLRDAPDSSIPVPTGQVPESLIQAEQQTLYDVAGKTPGNAYRELALKVKGSDLKPNTMEEIVPVETLLNLPTQKVLNIEEFLTHVGISAPDRFVRFLDKRFMFGVYTLRATDAFIIVEPTSFGPVFAELLDWEGRNLTELFYPLLTGKTLPVGSVITWSDSLIKNVDTRVGKLESGEVVMIYSFLPSKDKLVIASSLDTFNEVLLRSQSPKSVVQ